MQIGGDLAGVDQQLRDRVEAHVRQPSGGPHGLALAEHVQDQGACLEGQFVHTLNI